MYEKCCSYEFFCFKDTAIGHLHLHGNCDFLLCADQHCILHCDDGRRAPGLTGCSCGKNMDTHTKEANIVAINAILFNFSCCGNHPSNVQYAMSGKAGALGALTLA